MRPAVIDVFPDPPGVQAPEAYLARVETMYERDAYHSLSIEGYRVTPRLIERVRAGGWDPDENLEDRERVASVDQEIGPFATFVARAVSRAVGEFQ